MGRPCGAGALVSYPGLQPGYENLMTPATLTHLSEFHHDNWKLLGRGHYSGES
jgi:hypothetical protein